MLLEEKNCQYRQLLSNLDEDSLLPGVKSLLRQLRQSGLRVCVVSASKNTVLILRRLGILDDIDVISDGNDERLPGEGVYAAACRRLNLPVEACCLWENRLSGRAAAGTEGLRVISGSAAEAGALLGADAAGEAKGDKDGVPS